MNVISRRRIQDAQARHSGARDWLDAWWHTAKGAQWHNLHEVRQDYPAADQVGGCLVFDACGNNYRLIVGVQYANQWVGGTLYVKHFLTHTQYDTNHWKKDC